MSILVFLVAIAISATAAYYSIIGLITIFAASVVPVAIMGSVLEVGKLVTATWLYRNWKEVHWLMKSYLTTAVVVLMLITSMGIFGFLSKAHIEQTAEAEQNQSLIVRIDEQILNSEDRIIQLQNAGVVQNEKQNTQIAQNEKQIEQINSRYSELVEEQNNTIADARRNLTLLEEYIASGEVRKLQSLVGAKADGQYGSGTARRVEAFREAENAKSARILQDARAEITRLRQLQSDEVLGLAQANARLRTEIGTITVDVETVSEIETQIAQLRNEKFELETEFRKLEAEFGPITYISQLFYGQDAENKLDDAVRIVILMLIFVFDPLAILLLIASNHGHTKTKEDEDVDRNSVDIHTIPDTNEEDVVSKKDTTVEERIVKFADVEVTYDKAKEEFNFVEYPTDVRDDRLHPELRAKKEK